jgi:hypothetical protein
MDVPDIPTFHKFMVMGNNDHGNRSFQLSLQNLRISTNRKAGDVSDFT